MVSRAARARPAAPGAAGWWASRSSRRTGWPSCWAPTGWPPPAGGRCPRRSSPRACARRSPPSRVCSRRSPSIPPPRRRWWRPTASWPTCPTARCGRSAAPGRGRDVVRLCRRARGRLSSAWYDEADLADAAVEATTAGDPVTANVGAVVIHLVQELTQHQARLLRAVADRWPTSVVAARDRFGHGRRRRPALARPPRLQGHRRRGRRASPPRGRCRSATPGC